MIVMAANRCSACHLNWPVSYKQCPQCLGRVKRMKAASAILLKEARKLARAAEFDRFYAKHDEDRVGATPEELGRIDAAADIARIRSLERALST